MARPTRRLGFPLLTLLFVSLSTWHSATAQFIGFRRSRDWVQEARVPRKLFPINGGSAFIDISGRVVLTASDAHLIEAVRRASANLGGIRGESPEIRFNGFSEGFALVNWALCPMCRNPFNVSGFIDETGSLVITPKHRNSHYGNFREGLARYHDRGWGFIDRSGSVAIPGQFFEVGDFSEGLAYVRVSDKRQYGYINRTGQLVIPSRFIIASDFHEGLAIVSLNGERYAFIDRTGKVVLQFNKEAAVGHFSEGLAAVRDSVINNRVYRGYREQKYGFIDRTGKFVIRPQFDRVESFSEGRALFRIGRFGEDRVSSREKRKGSVGFIDAKGQVVIQSVYVNAKSFSEGLAAVAVESANNQTLWGYIDSQGRWVIQPQFQSANSFEGGLAAVNCDDYGRSCKAYVDKAGNIVWQTEPPS